MKYAIVYLSLCLVMYFTLFPNYFLMLVGINILNIIFFIGYCSIVSKGKPKHKEVIENIFD